MIEIRHTDSVVDTDVYPFFLRQKANLMDAGFAWRAKLWKDEKLCAVYAVENEKILGHIVYDYRAFANTLFIVLSAVDSEYRGQGIYKMMHEEFERVAKEKQCDSISSHVNKNNKVRLASAKSVDFLPDEVFMVKRIK